MDILVIIAVVVSFILRASKNKKAQEEARRKQEAARQAAAGPAVQSAGDPRFPGMNTPPRPTAVPARPTVQPTVARKPDPRFFDVEEDGEAQRAAAERLRQQRQVVLQEQERKRQLQQQTRQRVVLPDDEPEGTALPGSLSAKVKSTMSSTMVQPQGRRHTLEASSVTGHAHEETSITGLQNDKDCPSAAAMGGMPASYTFGGRALSFNRNAVVNGILYAEILGKPKALRRRA